MTEIKISLDDMDKDELRVYAKLLENVARQGHVTLDIQAFRRGAVKALGDVDKLVDIDITTLTANVEQNIEVVEEGGTVTGMIIK